MELKPKQKSETQKSSELQRLRSWVKKILPDDYDKYDIEAKFDSSLTYEENKSTIREDLKVMIKDLKGQAEQAQAQQERLEKERIQEAEIEAEEYNKRSYEENTNIDKIYDRIIRGVTKLSQGYSNLLFVRGRGGIGKSYQIRKALINGKADFVEVCGEVSEAYLYRLLFENNGKIIWFKDVVKLLQGQKSINLLKSATETEEKRLISKSNYSRAQDDLPDKFICKCKFIFDYNNLIGLQLKEDFEALVTRGDYIEMPFCNTDIQKIMKLIAKKDWEKEVTKFIINNFHQNGMIRLNLRTQWKAFKTYEYAEKNSLDWKKELKAELENISKIRILLYSLIGESAVRTKELKKLFLRNEIVSSLRTADRRVNEYLYLDELFKWSSEDRNFIICINPKK